MRRFCLVLPLLAGVLAGPVSAAPRAAAVTHTTSSAAYLSVWDNNVENLETPNATGKSSCRGDWHNLMHYMSTRKVLPDLFLVQQVTADVLKTLTAQMQKTLGVSYSYVLPRLPKKDQGTPCPAKKRQINGLIYRTARFGVVADRSFQMYRADSNGNCALHTRPSEKLYQDRSYTAEIQLTDKVANKKLTVESMHWPLKSGSCAQQNARRMLSKMTSGSYGGALHLFGGDTNYSDLKDPSSKTSGHRAWWKTVTSGYKDAIESLCAADKHYPTPACTEANWTISKSHRIDFVFAGLAGKRKPKMSAQHTVTFAEADPSSKTTTKYSDHRAVRAYVYY
jgi:hypothetical protein